MADFGWHYPPGVSDADIEKHFGDAPEEEEEYEGDPDDPEDWYSYHESRLEEERDLR